MRIIIVEARCRNNFAAIELRLPIGKNGNKGSRKPDPKLALRMDSRAAIVTIADESIDRRRRMTHSFGFNYDVITATRATITTGYICVLRYNIRPGALSAMSYCPTHIRPTSLPLSTFSEFMKIFIIYRHC